VFRNEFGSSGLPYPIPQELSGSRNLGFMFLPNYRAWVIVASLIVCIGTWFVIERHPPAKRPDRPDRQRVAPRHRPLHSAHSRLVQSPAPPGASLHRPPLLPK
jgi:hypothetical protein